MSPADRAGPGADAVGVRVGRLIQRSVGLVLVLVAVVALVWTPPGITPLRWPVVVTALSVLLVAAVALARHHGPPETVLGRSVRWRLLPAAVAVGGGVIAGAIGLMTRYRYGWDARVAVDVATALNHSTPLSPGTLDYLSMFPNNLPLVAIDRFGIAVAEAVGVDPDVVLIGFTAVAVGLTLWSVHALVSHVGTRGEALTAQAVTILLVATSPWVNVPYTDLYAMPFVTGFVALAVRAIAPGGVGGGGARVVYAVLLGLAAAFGFVIKTTPVVLVVAAAITVVVSAFDRRRQRPRAGHPIVAVTAVVAGAAIFAATSLALTAAAPTLAGLDASSLRPASPTIAWWVANGSLEGTSDAGAVGYGLYSREMVVAIHGASPQEMNAYAARILAERWDERGLAGTLSFYGHKLVWNWGDGMFWAWGEGNDALPGTLEPAGGVTGLVRAVNGFHGSGYPGRADLAQALWLATVLVAGVGLLRAPYRRDLVLLALVGLGIAAFTLVFQGRSRYLFTFVPVVVCLAACVDRDATAPLARRPAA